MLKINKYFSNLKWQWSVTEREWQASITTQAYKVWNSGGGGVCLCVPTDIHEQGRGGLLKQNKTLEKIHMCLFPTLKRYLSTEKTAKIWQLSKQFHQWF